MQELIKNVVAVIDEGINLLSILGDEIDSNVDVVITALPQAYIPIEWPDSQYLMEKDWFDECVLDVDSKIYEHSSSTYLVPIERYLELKGN